MNHQMLSQVGFLGETLIAMRLVANERALTCVHTKVIKEVMPFSEKHAAVVMVTLQNLHLPVSPWIQELEYSKAPGCWELFINLDLRNVKVSALSHFYGHALRNLCSHFWV